MVRLFYGLAALPIIGLLQVAFTAEIGFPLRAALVVAALLMIALCVAVSRIPALPARPRRYLGTGRSLVRTR